MSTYDNKMKIYEGTQLVNAKPMTRKEYNELRGWEVPSDENPLDDGYLIEDLGSKKQNHKDFNCYIFWRPKDVFESSYIQKKADKKSLHNSCVNGARKNVKDIRVFGNGDMFKLLCKASSENEGWMKSTKALQVDGIGCVVQVTTQQRNPDGSYSLAEALTFVPGVMIVPDENNGRKLKILEYEQD